MQKMYKDYEDIAGFYLIYIKEAHAEDSSRPVQYAQDLGIKQHTNYGERCNVAEKLFADKELTLPCLVDGMNDEANKAYRGYPDRVFVVRTDGKIAVAAERGPRGFKPALDETLKWLADLKQNNKEPPL